MLEGEHPHLLGDGDDDALLLPPVEETSQVQVGIRVRPLNSRELELGGLQDQVWTIKGNTISPRGPSGSSGTGMFTFGRGGGGVLDPTSP